MWNFLTCAFELWLRIVGAVVHGPTVSPCRMCAARALRLTVIVRCGFLLPVWWHSVTLRAAEEIERPATMRNCLT